MQLKRKETKHTQSKFQSATNDDKYYGILAGVLVVEADISSQFITLRHGGQPTLTTIKAINGAMHDLGIQGNVIAKVVADKVMITNHYNGETLELANELNIDTYIE